MSAKFTGSPEIRSNVAVDSSNRDMKITHSSHKGFRYRISEHIIPS